MFSFQDIVTCLTGVVVVITLLLAIDGLKRVSASTERDPLPLEAGVASLHAEVDDLRHELVKAREASTSDPEPWLAIAQLERLCEEEREAARGLELRRRAITRQIAEVKALTPPGPSESAIVAARARRDEAEARVEGLADPNTILIVPGDFARLPLVVVLYAESFEVGEYNEHGLQRVFQTEAANRADRLAGITDWLRGLRLGRRSHVVLFFTPSTIEEFRELSATLEVWDCPFGFEPLESGSRITMEEEP